MHQLHLTSRAEADIAAAFDWYEDRTPGLGFDFIRCVDLTISRLHASPQIFRKRHAEHRMAMTPRFPYAIYFIWNEAAGKISVRRVLHFAQNAPSYLKD